MAALVRIILIRVLTPAVVVFRFPLTSRAGFSRMRMVPVVAELETPLTCAVSV